MITKSLWESAFFIRNPPLSATSNFHNYRLEVEWQRENMSLARDERRNEDDEAGAAGSLCLNSTEQHASFIPFF